MISLDHFSFPSVFRTGLLEGDSDLPSGSMEG